jgi:hypothetical protein
MTNKKLNNESSVIDLVLFIKYSEFNWRSSKTRLIQSSGMENLILENENNNIIKNIVENNKIDSCTKIENENNTKNNSMLIRVSICIKGAENL